MFVFLRGRRGKSLALLCLIAPLFLMTPLRAQPRVRVAVFQSPPLMGYTTPDRPDGIFAEIIASVAGVEGWSIEYVPGTFAEGLARLERGDVDLMPSVALTSSRERIYAFNDEPVLNTWGQVYTRPNSEVRTILDLSGKRVAVLQDGVQQQYFDEIAIGFGVQATLQPWPDYASAFRAVAQGRADAVLANPFSGAEQAKAAGLHDTAIMFRPYALHFAASKAAPQLLQAIDRRMLGLKSDPTSAYFPSLERLMRVEPTNALPPWFEWAAGAAGVLAAMGAAWVFTLRRAAKRLRVSERLQRQFSERLAHVFDHSLDAIWVLDDGFRFVRASRASERLLGFPPREMLGRSMLELIPPKDRIAATGALRRIRGGVSKHSLQTRAVRKDGSLACLMLSAVWTDGRQEMYCIARDDTERREMISRLETRSSELQLANEELLTFSQTVSHDLRSPVAAISGFVAKVLEDAGSTLSERHLSLLQRSVAAARRMDQIIDDLLRLARISDQEIHRRPCDLGQMAVETAESLRHAGPAEGVQFTTHPDMQACADPQLMRTALENLIGNAWKFTSRTQNPSIVVGREELNGEDVFFVRDNGAGFDMQFACKMFLPFQRLHKEGEFEGSGIGLSIVHKVITRHGGRIWAESSPDQGAVFRFTLS